MRERLNEEGAKLGASQGALVMLDTSGAVKAMVDDYEWLALSAESKDSTAGEVVTRTFTKSVPAGARELTLDGVTGSSGATEARLASDGTLYVKRPSISSTPNAWAVTWI